MKKIPLIIAFIIGISVGYIFFEMTKEETLPQDKYLPHNDAEETPPVEVSKKSTTSDMSREEDPIPPIPSGSLGTDMNMEFP